MASNRVICKVSYSKRIFIIFVNADKSEEEQYKSLCKYKLGDRVRYKYKNDEIQTGSVIYINYSIIIKDSVTSKIRSVSFEEVVGYDTVKWLWLLIVWLS